MDNSIHLVVVEPNSRGGMIHHAYQLCRAFSDEGLNVQLITGTTYELIDFPHNFQVSKMLKLWELFDPESMQDPPKKPLLRVLRKFRWTLRRGIRAYRLVREWFRLTNHLIKLKPDIIQFGKINFPFETFFLRRLRNEGLILTQICHEFERRESIGPISKFFDRLYKSVYDNFSHIFFHAHENRERFLSLFPSYPLAQTDIIPLGNEEIFLTASKDSSNEQDLRHLYSIPSNQPVILFFGILSPSKGIEDLIDAFSIVHKQYDAILLIAGYPTKHMDIGRLKRQVQNHNLDKFVIFDTRYIPNEEVGLLMRTASVVVFPYRSSTQSAALQVAYSFGRPVIATSVGGLPEVIENGYSGYLVPPKKPVPLAEKIIALITDPDMADQMGAYGKHLSETKFGWGPIARKIVSIYQNHF